MYAQKNSLNTSHWGNLETVTVITALLPPFILYSYNFLLFFARVVLRDVPKSTEIQ